MSMKEYLALQEGDTLELFGKCYHVERVTFAEAAGDYPQACFVLCRYDGAAEELQAEIDRLNAENAEWREQLRTIKTYYHGDVPPGVRLCSED